MLIFPVIISLFLILILHSIFFLASKTESWEKYSKSVFECGFNSYFFSRFSFSSQYFIIALTFLFLDLELTFLMPFFNEENFALKINVFFLVFTTVLTLGLIMEWKMGMINWKS